jgi:ribose transport system ATP-binding protein
MSNHDMLIWEASGISKAFPGVQALDHVSIALQAGEVHALVGENGSGKSTLAKCFAGAHMPDAGQLAHNGHPVVFRHPLEARAEGVATIYQEFSLVPTLSVVENIFVGRYPRHAGTRTIDWEAMRRETLKVFEELSIKIDPDALIKDLSVAEQQLVEIAKAISIDSSLLIMDEPTAALGLVETERLIKLIRQLVAKDKAIIYISHRLDEVFQVADRVTILKDGRLVTTSPVSELDMAGVVRMMIGVDIQQHYPKAKNAQAVPCLELENLTTENGVNGVTFTVNVGEVLGLGGMLGSGRTEVARAIFGVDPIVKGSMRLNGHEVRFNSPNEAIRSGVGLIPENRKMDGLFFNFEGPKNITITRLAELLYGFLLNLGKEYRIGQDYVNKLNITPAALEKSVKFLSGGNQQKVIIGRWLFSKARLLILDEPTQGIDVGAKQEVYKVINELTAQGISIILISSDYPELLAMSDRVAVVRDGRVIHTSAANRLSQYQMIALASGVGHSSEIREDTR